MLNDLALVRSLESIVELNIFVFTTSIFFIFWNFVYRYRSELYERNIKRRNNVYIYRLNFRIRLSLYKRMNSIALFGAILFLVISWMSYGVSSLNLAEIRHLATADKANYLGTKGGILLSFSKYAQFLYPVLAVFSGLFITVRFTSRNVFRRFSLRQMLVPFFVAVLTVLANGGRNPLLEFIKFFLVGAVVAIPMSLSKMQLRSVTRWAILIVVGFVFFTTSVNDSRRSYYGQKSFSSNFSDSPLLSSLSGLIEYGGAHYYGYQIRNLDSYDGDNLGYGYYTFNSVFVIGLPLSSYHGLDLNFGALFGFEENIIDYFYLWKSGKEGYFTTNSVYLGLKMDFGFYGTLLFLFFFTGLTTRYSFLASYSAITFFGLSVYYFCFLFWSSSNFSSIFAGPFIGEVVMLYLFYKLLVIKRKLVI